MNSIMKSLNTLGKYVEAIKKDYDVSGTEMAVGESWEEVVLPAFNKFKNKNYSVKKHTLKTIELALRVKELENKLAEIEKNGRIS